MHEHAIYSVLFSFLDRSLQLEQDQNDILVESSAMLARHKRRVIKYAAQLNEYRKMMSALEKKALESTRCLISGYWRQYYVVDAPRNVVVMLGQYFAE